MLMGVKYVYCPKCKELRIKPWYTFTPRCYRCGGIGREIPVPRGLATYVLYAMMVVFFTLIYFNTSTGNDLLLYAAIGIVVIVVALQISEMIRGERYANSRIKTTASDHLRKNRQNRSQR